MKQVFGFKTTASKAAASIFSAVLAVAVLVVVPDADAKRMGGGKSVGKGSQTTQRDASPSNAAGNTTTSPAATPSAAAKAPAAAPAAAASNRSKWLGPLAGLAAGLGLAALASHLGFGEGLANIMMIALLALVAFAAFRFFMSRRSAKTGSAGPMSPAYAGASSGTANASPAYRTSLPPQEAAPYSGSSGAYTGGIGSALADGGLQNIDGFDEAGFVRQAKVYFVRLQAAYDSADQKDLREFTSPEMFAELMMEINERHGAVNRTEVEKLDAEFLGQGQDHTHQHVSIRFFGTVKEFEGTNTHAEPTSINETWNFAKPASGAEGWTLVGIEQN